MRVFPVATHTFLRRFGNCLPRTEWLSRVARSISTLIGGFRIIFCSAGKPRVSPAQEKQLVEELSKKLYEACVSRLVSDVPLGVFLSGGIDSSTLVAMMSELTPGNVNSFSVAFEEKSFNEEPYADFVARHFHTRHRVVTADEPSMREALQILAGHLDEPLADPAVIPTYLLSRFARQHIKVALSGEGSDELFGGYPTYIGAWLADYYLRLPRFLRHEFFERLRRFLPVSTGAVPIGWYLRQFLSHAEQAARRAARGLVRNINP